MNNIHSVSLLKTHEKHGLILSQEVETGIERVFTKQSKSRCSSNLHPTDASFLTIRLSQVSYLHILNFICLRGILFEPKHAIKYSNRNHSFENVGSSSNFSACFGEEHVS